MRTHESRDLQPKLGAADLKRYTKLRFKLEHPDSRCPRTSRATVYIGAQFLFRSRDHGQTWGTDLAGSDHQRSAKAEAGTVRWDHRR